MVRYDGQVFYKVMGLIQILIDIDYTYFPFEKQNVNMDVMSWMYLTDDINLIINDQNSIKLRNSETMSNSLYEINKNDLKYNKITKIYKVGDNVQWQESNIVKVWFQVQRTGRSIIAQVLLPSCISFFQCLLSFLLDKSKPLRIVVSTGNMMKILLFLVLSNNYVPQTDIQPILQMTILYFFYVTYGVVVSQVIIQQYTKVYSDIYKEDKHQYQQIEQMKEKTQKILNIHQCVQNTLMQKKPKQTQIANRLFSNFKKQKLNKVQDQQEQIHQQDQTNQQKEYYQKNIIGHIKQEDKQYFQNEDDIEFNHDGIEVDIDYSEYDDDDNDIQIISDSNNIVNKLDKLMKDDNNDNQSQSELSILIDQQLQEDEQIMNPKSNNKQDIELLSLNEQSNKKQDKQQDKQSSIQKKDKSKDHIDNKSFNNSNEIVDQNLLEIDSAEKKEKDLQKEKEQMLSRFWILKYRKLYPEQLDQILFSIIVISYIIVVLISIILVVMKYEDNKID